MNLSGKQKNYLRGVAHSLNPVVTVGAKGLSEAVMAEIELALDQHELIKIKLPGASKAEKTAALNTICEATQAAQVQLIGRVGVIYRAADQPKLMLPSI